MSISFLHCSLFKKNANENLVGICHTENSEYKISYLDSTHGITKISTETRNDTLFLKIYVSYVRTQTDYCFKINNNIKYLCIGKKTIDIKDIPICKINRSRKEALEYIKKLNIE
jgi:hypothetical protein